MVGEDVKITFWDHSEGKGGPVKFNLHGRVVKETPLYLEVQSWYYADEPADYDDGVVENNVVYNILKSTIVSCKVPTKERNYRYAKK